MKIFTFCVLTLIVLGGCSSNGSTYSSLPDTSLHPKEGMAQLVIYRPDSFKYFARTLGVELKGNTICDLPNGRFLIKDIDPSKITIKASLWGMLGTSRKTIRTHAGEQYFVKVAVDEALFSAGVADEEAAGGPLGSLANTGNTEELSSHAGPFLIEIMDEKVARAELQSLRMSMECQ